MSRTRCATHLAMVLQGMGFIIQPITFSIVFLSSPLSNTPGRKMVRLKEKEASNEGRKKKTVNEENDLPFEIEMFPGVFDLAFL